MAARVVPDKVLKTLKLIKSNTSWPYRKDGTVFYNNKRLLPIREDGYYREFTIVARKKLYQLIQTSSSDVEPSGERGLQRLVMGGNKKNFYYSNDHYDSFMEIVKVRAQKRYILKPIKSGF